MNNGFILYKAELKKIVSKRAIWIAMAIGLVFVLLVGLTNLSADGHGVYVKYQEETLAALNGEKMDQQFFDRFHQTVDAEIQDNWSKYEKIASYDPGTMYMNASTAVGQKALYDLIYNTVRDREKMIRVTAEEYYEAMREDIIKDSEELGSSDEETKTWLSVYDGNEQPMTYSYALAYSNILDVLFIIGWVLILNIAIALAGTFADEKTYRTDAMILSAKKGRGPVCLAKIAASVTVAVAEAVILLGGCVCVMFVMYGTSGWSFPIQNVIPSSPWNITIGGMMGIFAGLAVLVSIFYAVTNMLVSQLTKSSVATMAIHAATIFVGLFNVPGKMGIIAKIWQLKPTMALYYGTFCNTFMYGHMNNVEIVFISYIVMAAVFAGILFFCYGKSQVESR